jgi:MFS family permease
MGSKIRDTLLWQSEASWLIWGSTFLTITSVGPAITCIKWPLTAVIEPYMAEHHPSTSIHGYLLPLINGSSFFGRIIGGLLADKFGRLNLLYPMTLLSGLLCLAMWLPAINVATVVAFVSLYGFSSGIFISVTPAVVAQISPEDRIGARIGAFFTLSAVATLTGTPIAGTLIKKGVLNGYNDVIIFAVSIPSHRNVVNCRRLILCQGVTMTVGSLFFFIARILCDKDLRKKW